VTNNCLRRNRKPSSCLETFGVIPPTPNHHGYDHRTQNSGSSPFPPPQTVTSLRESFVQVEVVKNVIFLKQVKRHHKWGECEEGGGGGSVIIKIQSVSVFQLRIVMVYHKISGVCAFSNIIQPQCFISFLWLFIWNPRANPSVEITGSAKHYISILIVFARHIRAYIIKITLRT